MDHLAKSPATAPIGQPTLYLVFAGTHEPYLCERELSEMDRATTIKDIASGEWENVTRVLLIEPVNEADQFFLGRDVTQNIAREVMTIWAHSGEPLTRWQRSFVEQHVSVQAANSFAMERA